MKNCDIIYNKIYTNELGEEFVFIEDGKVNKKNLFLIKFNKTNNYQLAYPSSSIERVRDYSIPRIYGVGYATGTKDDPVRFDYEYYPKWVAMIGRCYKNGGYKSYKDVTVCDDWKNFTNFKKWANSNNYITGFALDKDLFGENNRIYSPKTCCFMPNEINSCIIGLGKKCQSDINETKAKTIYHLSLLIKKYDGIISKRVNDKLSKIISDYKANYKETTGCNINIQFRDFKIKKLDLSKIEITSFVEYNGHIFKFKTLDELKIFVLEKEEEELIKQESPLEKR